jgi:membrane-bound ClpP family serine protease
VGSGEGKESKTMSEKIVNDTVSYIKTIADTRGRNVEWAEKGLSVLMQRTTLLGKG